MKDEKKSSNPSEYSLLARVSSVSAGMGLLVLLGFWLDCKFHTTPVLTITASFLGVAYSLYEGWRLLKEK